MTQAEKLRESILSQYRVDSHGRITSPGKFEGEMLYVPYFWNEFLDGGADEDDGEVLGFDVLPEDKEAFPELRRRRKIRLMETDQGFVVEV